MIMSLGEDHTRGTKPGAFTPDACVASNDIGLGKIVEAATRSRFWKEMAIFVIEDDAQNGPDHGVALRCAVLQNGFLRIRSRPRGRAEPDSLERHQRSRRALPGANPPRRIHEVAGGKPQAFHSGSRSRKNELLVVIARVIRLVPSAPATVCQSGLVRPALRCKRIPVAPLAQDSNTLPGPARATWSIGSGYGLK